MSNLLEVLWLISQSVTELLRSQAQMIAAPQDLPAEASQGSHMQDTALLGGRP